MSSCSGFGSAAKPRKPAAKQGKNATRKVIAQLKAFGRAGGNYPKV